MTPEPGMDTIHIVSAADDTFAIPLGVMLTSLFENSPYRELITVHILDGGISSDQPGKNTSYWKKISFNHPFSDGKR